MSKFNVGDRVRVVPPGRGFDLAKAGDEGTVRRAGVTGDLNLVEFQRGNEWAYDHEIELVTSAAPAAPEFRVGDRVRAIEDGWSTTGAAGMLGVIKDHFEYTGGYLVELDEGGPYESCVAFPKDDYRLSWFDPDALEKVEPPRFKVGDRVHTNAGYSFDPNIGVVTEVRPDGMYKIRVDHPEAMSRSWTYPEDRLTASCSSCDKVDEAKPASPWSACPSAEVDNQRDEYGPAPRVFPMRRENIRIFIDDEEIDEADVFGKSYDSGASDYAAWPDSTAPWHPLAEPLMPFAALLGRESEVCPSCYLDGLIGDVRDEMEDLIGYSDQSVDAYHRRTRLNRILMELAELRGEVEGRPTIEMEAA